MDFFARQDQARRNTKWLTVYFALAILMMTAGIYLVSVFIFTGKNPTLWNPPLLAGVAAVTFLIILIGSMTKTLALRGGGGGVAQSLGGRPLEPNPTSLEEQRLQNVVEEMALASGTPVPEIYILDHEKSINAFAAGHTPADAAIGVTRGTLTTLNRDELQGVIAHEFSHILNGDMRLNIRLMGLVHGILCLAILGRVLLHTGTRRSRILGARNRGGNPLPLLGLALIILGSIGVFFGRLIKSAVSRQREFLADAAAVQFTRNPSGLAGALKKIGGRGSRLHAPNAEEASHLFFGNGIRPAWLQMMATHPPLIDRIRALEPSFDGTFPRVEIQPPPPARRVDRPGAPRVIPPPRLQDLMGQAAGAAGMAFEPVRAQQTIQSAGNPSAMHLAYAIAWRQNLPETLNQAAHDPSAAPALIYALLLSHQSQLRQSQIDQLSDRLEPATHQRLQALAGNLQGMDLQIRLPLIDLSLNALRRLTPAQYQTFMGTTRWIIEQDRQIDLFEFTLQTILEHHLDPHFRPAPPRVVQFYSLKPLLPDCRVLVSALAQTGHSDPLEVQRAFRLGYGALDPAHRAQPLPLASCTLDAIGTALNRLAQAAPQIKKRLLDAASQTVAADGIIQPPEAELIRAIGETLDCPIPPFLHGIDMETTETY